MKCTVTRDEFFEAVGSGDTHAIARFFEQRSADSVALDASERRADHEWPLSLAPTSLVATVIASDYVDVLEWLFSKAAIATIESVILVAMMHTACGLALRGNGLELLELMLESPVFAQALSVEGQQNLLDQLLSGMKDLNNPDVVRQLIAHGARVNSQTEDGELRVLMRSARRLDPWMLNTIVQEGALTIGAEVFDDGFMSAPVTMTFVITLGLRPVHAAERMHHAVAHGRVDEARFLLEYGYIDVDARDPLGQTPLMVLPVGWIGPDRRQMDWHLGADMAALLLEYGADPNARDSQGKSPLLHAVGSRSPEVIRLLLDHGADPNQPTGEGRVALDCFDFAMLAEETFTEQLEYLLQFGADPLKPSVDGLSAVDRLRQTEVGRNFIAAHEQWFAEQQQSNPSQHRKKSWFSRHKVSLSFLKRTKK